MGLAAGTLLLLVLFAYVFWPDERPFIQGAKTRLEFLQERREVVFDNLRDLNFEFKSGKYPPEDYEAQRSMLESEAATIVREMDTLQST